MRRLQSRVPFEGNASESVQWPIPTSTARQRPHGARVPAQAGSGECGQSRVSFWRQIWCAGSGRDCMSFNPGGPDSEANASRVSQRRQQLHSMVRPLRPEESDSASRLRLALEMMGAGLEMKRLSLQRAHPQESLEQISERLNRWIRSQPISPGLRLRSLF